jgi:tripartite-type tricarboxylate transporter receptor subunit TctC
METQLVKQFLRSFHMTYQKDFEPISLMGAFDVLMLVDKNSDIQSVSDFIAKAKANRQTIQYWIS